MHKKEIQLHRIDQIYRFEVHVVVKNSIQHLFYWRYCTSLCLNSVHKPWTQSGDGRFATFLIQPLLWKCIYNLSSLMKIVSLLSPCVHSALNPLVISERFKIPRKSSPLCFYVLKKPNWWLICWFFVDAWAGISVYNETTETIGLNYGDNKFFWILIFVRERENGYFRLKWVDM